MPYTFKIDNLTDIKIAYEELERMAKRFNSRITGEDISGNISTNGFEGSYQVGREFVNVAIRKNPFPLISNKRVANEIEGFLVKIFHNRI